MALTISTNKNWSDYECTSVSSNSVGTGTLNFTIETSKGWTAGDDIALVPQGSKIPTFMIGTVTSYDSGTGALTVNINRFESDIPSIDLVSSSSNTIGTGSKTFVTFNGKSSQLAASDPIIVARVSTNADKRFIGTVTSYNNADGTLVMNCTSTNSSGTSQTDWIIVSSGTFTSWKIVPSPVTTITLTGSSILTIDMEPSYHVGSFQSLDRGVINITNNSTTTPCVIELGCKNTNGAKLFQLENNGGLSVVGNMINVHTGTGASGQTIDLSSSTYNKIDFPAIEVETASGSGVYRPWYVLEDAATNRGFIGKNFVSRGAKSYFDAPKNATVTLTTATPTVISWNGHNLRPGMKVRFTTTGTYSGITTGTDYFISPTNFTTNAFSISASPQGSLIAVTAQSGTRTCFLIQDIGIGLHGNVALFNPSTRILTFGNGTQGNVIPNGAKVRIPNIHFTSEYPRTPLMSAISSATAGNAISVNLGQAGSIFTSTGMSLIIDEEEFTGTVTSQTLATTARALLGSAASNHAQGATVFNVVPATGTTTTNRGLMDTVDGGKVELNTCSFGNIFLFLQNNQICNVVKTWVVGGVNIGATTANVNINGLYNSAFPTSDSGVTVANVLGSLSVENVYSFGTNVTTNQSTTVVSLSANQNVLKISNLEAVCGAKNGTSSSAGLSIAACLMRDYITNLIVIGGRLTVTNMNTVEVDGIIHSSEMNGIKSANIAYNAIAVANCQEVVFRNISKAENGAACRNQLFTTDANCSDVLFHSINYDSDSNTALYIQSDGNNIRMVNANLGTLRDASSTSSSTCGLTNRSTADTTLMQNIVCTVPDVYGLENGLGQAARCFYEYCTGHSLWWRAVAFSGNYQEMGPFHVLLDNGTNASGTLFSGPYGVEASRDIYTLGGSTYFNNGGSIFLPVTNDFVIIKSYQALRTITGFSATEFNVEAVNPTNMTYEFELQNYGTPFTGVFTTLSAANLETKRAALVGYDSNIGLAIQIKVTATADSATNSITNFRLYTTNDIAPVLPIGYTNFNFSGLASGSTVGIYDGATLLGSKFGLSGTATLKEPYDFDGQPINATVKIRTYGYEPNDYAQAYYQFDIDKVVVPIADASITQSNAATVESYAAIDTCDKLYDYCQYFLTTAAGLAYSKFATSAGSTIDFGSKNIVIDASAVSVFSYNGATVTIKAASLLIGSKFVKIKTTGTITFTGSTAGSNLIYESASGTSVPVVVNNITAGSRLQIYNTTDDTEVANVIVSGTAYNGRVTWSADKNYRIRLTHVDGTTAKQPFVTTGILTNLGISVTASQLDCGIYNGYGIDGSAVTGFSADYIDNEVDLVVNSNFYINELFAWWAYNLTTADGIRYFFGGIAPIDEGNIQVNNDIVDIYLDNTTSTGVWALDNRRFFRADGLRPVKTPTTGGGGIDVEWREKVLFVNDADIAIIKKNTGLIPGLF